MLRIETALVFPHNPIGAAILLKHHKTASTRGSLTVHVPPEVMELILFWSNKWTSTSPGGNKWVFLGDISARDKHGEVSWEKARNLLKRELMPATDLRGLRRGGICHSSLIATTEEELLPTTDHASVRNLTTYMAGGLLNQTRRRLQLQFANYNVAASTAQPQTRAGHTYDVSSRSTPHMDNTRTGPQQM